MNPLLFPFLFYYQFGYLRPFPLLLPPSIRRSSSRPILFPFHFLLRVPTFFFGFETASSETQRESRASPTSERVVRDTHTHTHTQGFLFNFNPSKGRSPAVSLKYNFSSDYENKKHGGTTPIRLSSNASNSMGNTIENKTRQEFKIRLESISK